MKGDALRPFILGGISDQLFGSLKMDAQSLSQLSRVIDQIYAGAMDLQAWPAVLREVSDWMRAPHVTLFTPFHRPEQGGFMNAHALTAEDIHAWATKYQPLDPWAERAQARGYGLTGQIIRDQDLMPPEELLETPFYRGFLAPLGMARLATAVIFGVDSAQQHGAASDMPMLCSCNRPLAQPFTDADAFRLRLLLPHFSRALGVVFRLRQADFKLACSLAALDRMPKAVILFDAQGDIFHANQAAQRLLALNDGLRLSDDVHRPGQSRLRAVHAQAQSSLQLALMGALTPDGLHAVHFNQSVLVPRTSGEAPFGLHFSSLPVGNEFGRGAAAPMAIAFIDDGQSHIRPDANTLCARYELTPAEWRVAEALAHGLSTDDIAQTLGVAVSTVKSHLRQLYAKTGTGNRVNLMRMLMSSQTPVSTWM
jgi:DNA-binding CsgD family transcriptional regulator/PAS domain-containing protein